MKNFFFIIQVLAKKWLMKGLNYLKSLIDPISNDNLTFLIDCLFEKANLILKHVLLFTWGRIIARRGFVWFLSCHFRFWLNASPPVYVYFVLGITLLITGALLKHNCDVIAALIEFDLLELSDTTVFSAQELVNLKTNYGHYACVQNDQLPKDWSEMNFWMRRFQNESAIELQKYNELHHTNASQLPAQELKNLSDAAQRKQAPDESTNFYAYGVFFILIATLYIYVGY